MRRYIAFVLPFVFVLGAMAQPQRGVSKRDKKFPVSGAQLDFVLPSAFNNTQMRHLTEVIGQLGLNVQFPLYKGLGIGGAFVPASSITTSAASRQCAHGQCATLVVLR